MLGWIGASRLAKPHSPWARWFYGPQKMARAASRLETGAGARFQQRLVDLVRGQSSL